jgi:hypothetical protein
MVPRSQFNDLEFEVLINIILPQSESHLRRFNTSTFSAPLLLPALSLVATHRARTMLLSMLALPAGFLMRQLPSPSSDSDEGGSSGGGVDDDKDGKISGRCQSGTFAGAADGRCATSYDHANLAATSSAGRSNGNGSLEGALDPSAVAESASSALARLKSFASTAHHRRAARWAGTLAAAAFAIAVGALLASSFC